MRHRRIAIAVAALPVLLGARTARGPQAQTEKVSYARIAFMRALDGHSVDWEAGYVRHLEWHRQAKDPFNWYSYSIWASTERHIACCRATEKQSLLGSGEFTRRATSLLDRCEPP